MRASSTRALIVTIVVAPEYLKTLPLVTEPMTIYLELGRQGLMTKDYCKANDRLLQGFGAQPGASGWTIENNRVGLNRNGGNVHHNRKAGSA
jgi:hypothetical protein